MNCESARVSECRAALERARKNTDRAMNAGLRNRDSGRAQQLAGRISEALRLEHRAYENLKRAMA